MSGTSQPSSDFEYDVAFSFLDRDEALATELADLLQGRFRCFIYSRRQEQIAGTDGEETFNRIFGGASRLVVILYRDGWGETAWTRIEQTAIRNRAFTNGYDFTLFTKLTPKDTLPLWVPKPYIWLGFERWGAKGTASVIEAKIESAGGAPQLETATNLAKRLRRTIDLAEARKGFLNSYDGVAAANAAFLSLVQSTRGLADKVQAQDPALQFRFDETTREFVVYAGGFSLSYHWQTQWANMLTGSTLFLRLHKGFLALHGPGSVKVEALLDLKLDFDGTTTGSHCWRMRSDDRSFTSIELADYAMSEFLKRVYKT